MDIKVKNKDLMQEYRISDAEGRFNIMMDNYCIFPKIIRKMEKKTQYRIKCEKEYARSKHRGELGVRVQTSKLSDPTFEEAATNIMIEEALKTGEDEGGILNGIENAAEYEADIRMISIMRMDFELLAEIVEDMDTDDNNWLKDYLEGKKLLKEIATEQERTYDAMKKRVMKMKVLIRDEILECLEMNCEGGM